MKDYLLRNLQDISSQLYDYLHKYFHVNERLRDQNGRLVGKVFVKTRDLEAHKKYLDEARIEIDTLRSVNKALRLIMKELVIKKEYVYKCPHCTFEGREYRDFCPGCDKDSKGNTAINYKTKSCKTTPKEASK